MTKRDVARQIVGSPRAPEAGEAEAYAEANLALSKYWGKRDAELNLPAAPSLSVSLTGLGTRTVVRARRGGDRFWLNGQPVAANSDFSRRLREFLDLFRPSPGFGFEVRTENRMPTGAGLASSASGFASLVLALDRLFGWDLPGRQLSVLARLGSGSACRSIFRGFVLWHRGERDDGLDSYAEPLPDRWPELRIGVLTVRRRAKELGSRRAMQRVAKSSPYYAAWIERCHRDFRSLLDAIREKDFERLGQVSEANALAMHAASLAAWPPVFYFRPATVTAVRRVWRLREEGYPVYFSIDAGPNVKLLFPAELEELVRSHFPGVEIVRPFP